jgi:hypothetical protein
VRAPCLIDTPDSNSHFEPPGKVTGSTLFV